MYKIGTYFDKRQKATSLGYPIYLNISYKGKRFMLSTGLYAYGYDRELGFAESEPAYKLKNIRLKKIITKIEEKLYPEDLPLNTVREELGNIITGKEPEKRVFLDYFDEFAITKTKPTTRQIYELTRDKLEEYSPTLRLEDITVKWLTGFQNHLLKTMKINSVSIHLRNIRAVFNYCIDNKYVADYPFRAFKIKHETTMHRCLTVEQLRRLRDFPCEDYQKKYRDMFMLMFYLIGINGIDLYNLPANDGDRIEYRRAKTGKLYNIKIEPEAKAILDKYKGINHSVYIAEEYANHKDFFHRMSSELKKIGSLKWNGNGTKKHITPLFPDISPYWARYTWATIAFKIGIPKDIISLALGHSFGSPTTDIYIDYDNSKVDEANRKVIDYVNGDMTAEK